MNYSELLTNVRNYTEVGSEVLSDSIIDVFITNIENKVQRELDLDAFRKFQFSSFTIGSPFITMPDDFAFERGVQIKDQITGDRTWLEQRDTTFIDEYNKDRSDTGTPKYYANWDQNTMIFAPTPDAAYEIELWYNKTPDHLSSSQTTTWLSTNAPEVLIYGTVAEAFSYLKNPPYVQLYEQKYAQAVQNLAQTQMGRKRRDEYADGVLRIPLRSVDPGGK
ncbi:MAG TPA: hypothetical protein VMW50_11910 [Dehalococcoidia bacterium]|nr:hypothetical protein [Dehalococcoidia bacterium]